MKRAPAAISAIVFLRARRARAGLAIGLGFIWLQAFGAHAADPSWNDVERLVSDHKFEAAAEAVVKLREQARKTGDEEGWAKALVREAQLRTGLGGYETTVRLLQEQPWPKAEVPRTALRLYRAWALVQYAGTYGYEIRQRERVATGTGGDLKGWTMDQIFAAAVADYVAVWTSRETLGHETVAKMGQFLDAGSYPAEVRGTLRDAVSYLFVDLLTREEGWRPEQSNDLFALDLPALIAGDPGRSRLVKLGDPAVHPVVKISAILDDLEAWHLQHGARDAALETRLERARRLHAIFTDDADRDRITQDLERRLPAFADRPWWSAGQGTLAQLVAERGDLARADALARAGEKAYPSSVGGALCRALANSLELPDYLLTSKRADGVGRRSLEVQHKNLAALYFRVYRLDLEERLRSKGGSEPTQEEMRQLLKGAPIRAWSVSLPATPDLRMHKTYVTPPLDKRGFYAIAASTRPDFQETRNKIVGVTFLATDIVLVDRAGQNDAIEAEVLEGASGRPVAGADVELCRVDYRTGTFVEASGKTDAEGLVRFTVRTRDRPFFLLARHGGSLALDPNIWLWWWSEPRHDTNVFVYTDRPIYRPLQKIYFKAIVYRGRAEEARYHVAANHAVTVTLKDANGQEVDKRMLRTNAYGSVAGELPIPAGRLLGQWRLETDLGGAAVVRVEEYKRPTFEVKLEDSKQPLRLNRPASIEGEARYYFGLPVASGVVRWRVTREPVYPFWWGWFFGSSATETQTIASGTVGLDPAGHFRVTFTANEDERQGSRPAGRKVTYLYRVDADVTEEGGETRSAGRSFRLGYVSVEAHLDAGAGFLREGVAASIAATRTDLDGVPRAGAAHWRLLALRQPTSPVLPADEPLVPRDDPHAIATPGDRLRPRWEVDLDPRRSLAGWTDGAEMGQGALVHDARGETRVPLPKLAPGAYRLRYETTDEQGGRFETSTELIVVGDRTPLALPAVLAIEKTTVPVGGTVRVFAASGFSEQQVVVDIWRSGARVLRRRLVAGRDKPLLELPVKPEDRGGFVVSLEAVRDYQVMTTSVSVQVPWDDRQLTVDIATFRDTIRPGAKETWKVTVKGPPGAKPEAAGAELLAYMYDRSLDLFAPHAPADPMSIWPNRQRAPVPQSSGGQGPAIWIEYQDWASTTVAPILHGARLKFEPGYPIGGPGYSFADDDVSLDGLEGKVAGEKADAAVAEPPRHAFRAHARLRLSEKMKANEDRDGDGIPDQADLEEETRGQEPAPTPAPRSNFSETAFWAPQLLTGPDGAASLEFTVPDSVTAWSVWVHAVTKDLLSGSTHRETRSAKELMVRPSVPRFLREGDRAFLKVVVNNASTGPLAGELRLEVVDPDTGKDIGGEFGLRPADRVRPFKAVKDGGAEVTFPIVAPVRVRQAAFRVTAAAGAFSDGELRPLPVLPSRVHLVQSRFVTLHDRDRRQMTFKDLTDPDETRVNDQMVVTVDAQLFTTVLRALPYLVTYPYECTEQTLNRFLSAAIVTSVFRDNPTVARLGRELASRDKPLETFDATDPNRKMALEESPWLEAARGDPLEKGSKSELVKVLDPAIAAAERAASLAKLTKAQAANGGFPWFPGGPPDPYMTLYIMSGFARAAEFKVDIPKEVVQRGWTYLASEFREHHAAKLIKQDCCWEWLTFLNYVASSYPDASWLAHGLTAAERQEILDFSFKHWKQHSPYLKGLLALTLKRAGRAKDANLVWASVMDAAKLRPDEGLSFAPEDRSWLWYEDTIETQAFALRALLEIEPDGPRKKERADGLVLWLLLHKKLNQWKSTRATAEVIYSLVHYLKREGALGVRESARVSIGGKTTEMIFEPDAPVTKARIVIPGPEVSAKTASISVAKDSKGFAFASATWSFSTEKLPAEERGDFFSVSRHYFRRESNGREFTLTPLAAGAVVKPGDELEVHLSLRTKQAAEYIHLRDPRGAGFEPESSTSHYNWDLGISWYEETRDSGANFFFERLPAGEYTFKYRVRANMAGRFRVGPATVESMYAPEFNAYSTGAVLDVAQ